MIYYDSYNSPLGEIFVVVDAAGVNRIELIKENWLKFIVDKSIKRDYNACFEVIKQLDEYFSGKRKYFHLKLSIEGTEFRKKVWEALIDIPYGEVVSYSSIAKTIGNPKAVRAVGQANRANPLPIIIPCHRVIGKDKRLVGYAGTRIDIKKKLLRLEGVNLV
ncbi:methylated-DNA--[protein]-cysteine S-methyltransferase [Clostridium sp. SYSU_GA19001]|nr:methylated-DNA--[protein]-cysteine S-methyltransferase [Clostridium caldaquaticum]MCM8710453.1 methylated-DNA--[protein]-cysteine S-methyltransferase [Clostridium caldaquaticum]